MNFRITGVPADQFAHLFALTNAELVALGAVRRKADGPSPCRVSLTDTAPGDDVILINFEHHAVASPYRMCFAIYVRPGEETLRRRRYCARPVAPAHARGAWLRCRGHDDRQRADRRHLARGRD